MRGAEGDDPIVDHLAQVRLHQGRGAVGHHGAHVLQAAAHEDQGRGERDGNGEGLQGGALEDAPQQPSEQGQAADASDDLEQTDEHGGGDAQAHALREAPQLSVEIHER